MHLAQLATLGRVDDSVEQVDLREAQLGPGDLDLCGKPPRPTSTLRRS
jgi:hypothetical protein